MKRITMRLAALFALFTGGLAALPVFAHEKWYADDTLFYSSKPIIFAEPTLFGLTVLGLTFVVLAVLYKLDRMSERAGWARKFDKTYESMRVEAKAVLAALLGASLMGAGLNQTFLAPNLQLPGTLDGVLMGIASIVLGLLFMFFIHLTAELALALLAFYLLGFAFFPPHLVLEELLMVAIAIYFVTQEARRMPWKRWNTAEMRRKGLHLFRVVLGFAFVYLSFVKWLRPDLAITLVDQYNINFISGIGFDSAHFVFFAAATEAFIGLAIIFRIFLRPISILGIFVFSASIFVFGFPELLGHLPIKGALFILFIHGPYLERWPKDREVI